MYWITTRPCLKCGELVLERDPQKYSQNEKYQTLKAIILNELKTKSSNPWPDEGIGLFGLGMVKIFVSKKRHEYLKYKMKCFQCGYEIEGEELEKLIEEKRKKSLPYDAPKGTDVHLDLRKNHTKAVAGKLGLFKYSQRVVPPLEQFL